MAHDQVPALTKNIKQLLKNLLRPAVVDIAVDAFATT